jgi:hypothetical protein
MIGPAPLDVIGGSAAALGSAAAVGAPTAAAKANAAIMRRIRSAVILMTLFQHVRASSRQRKASQPVKA